MIKTSIIIMPYHIQGNTTELKNLVEGAVTIENAKRLELEAGYPKNYQNSTMIFSH